MLLACLTGVNHDHSHCKSRILEMAEARCRERGVRLTKQRRRVLEILADSHHAVGAYEILERFRPEQNARTAPITIYRALDFLMENNLAHRLSSLNAFVACSASHDKPGTQLFFCQNCQSVAEISRPAVHHALNQEARFADFTLTAQPVEIPGICAACKTGRPTHD
ncbi:MAG: transcriptional repressor [Magnetococcales bacterium]|nr:transcriptional repressor [Magnetococcales bacterium]